MTSMAVMPRATEWTVDDLEHLPDDGLQYELLDGILLVTPAPVPAHQAVAGELYVRLRAACPPHLKVFFAPLDWQPDRRTSLQPDLLVIPRDDIGLKNLTRPLALAVEVLSPSTWRKDPGTQILQVRGLRCRVVLDRGPDSPVDCRLRPRRRDLRRGGQGARTWAIQRGQALSRLVRTGRPARPVKIG